MQNFTIEVDADGIALITFNVPDRSINTITAQVIEELPLVTDYLKMHDDVRGAVLCSGKPNAFCAGADLGEMGRHESVGTDAAADLESLQREFETLYGISKLFREFERNGKPVAAAIEGLALGGGLEWLLDCQYRVIADNPRLRIGLPESTLGLLPGGGGTQRLPRLIGIEAALALILEGRSVGPHEALKLGIVHAIAAPGEVVQAAKDWVRTKGDALQPWDRPDFIVPGGGPYAGGGLALRRANADVAKKYRGNYPAYSNILKCVYEGIQVPIDAALRIESRYMLRTMKSPQAKAMVRTLFLSQQAVSKGLGRPAGLPKAEIRKVSIVKPDKIGAMLALEQVGADIQTVLLAPADAMPALRKMLRDEGAKLRMPDKKLVQVMERIIITNDMALIRGSDLVLLGNREALAAEVIGDAAEVLLVSGEQGADDGGSKRFDALLNFPEGRTAPVEVIKGEATPDRSAAKIVDYVVKLRKVPIVVGGSYLWRVAQAYADEGHRMLADGFSPILIENAGLHASMAQGPLAAARLFSRTGTSMGVDVISETKVRGGNDGAASIDELKARLLFRQCIEAMLCMSEGVVADARIADVGAILGWGFASWTGGPFSYIDMLGIDHFVAQCDRMSGSYGPRFSPPKLLLEMAEAGKSFH